MAHNPEEYCRLRRQFIEAAAKYEPAGYRTFIQRTARSEENYFQRGRHDFVAYMKWPHRPWRTCMIFAPNSGEKEKPFSTMKRLFTKAWLWLPAVIVDGVVDATEKHLSPPAELGLYWARSHYQLWAWLLWFDWLWRYGEVETEEPEVPAAGMDLRPFSCSADLIARWGLDRSAGILPVWLAELVIERKGAGTGPSVGRPRGVTTEPAGPVAKPQDAAGGAENPGVTAQDLAGNLNSRTKRRPAYARDHLWLGWHTAGAKRGEIRNRWNEMTPAERKPYAPTDQTIDKGKPGWSVVDKALRRARQEAESEAES